MQHLYGAGAITFGMESSTQLAVGWLQDALGIWRQTYSRGLSTAKATSARHCESPKEHFQGSRCLSLDRNT